MIKLTFAHAVHVLRVCSIPLIIVGGVWFANGNSVKYVLLGIFMVLLGGYGFSITTPIIIPFQSSEKKAEASK